MGWQSGVIRKMDSNQCQTMETTICEMILSTFTTPQTTHSTGLSIITYPTREENHVS